MEVSQLSGARQSRTASALASARADASPPRHSFETRFVIREPPGARHRLGSNRPKFRDRPRRAMAPRSPTRKYGGDPPIRTVRTAGTLDPLIVTPRTVPVKPIAGLSDGRWRSTSLLPPPAAGDKMTRAFLGAGRRVEFENASERFRARPHDSVRSPFSF